MRIPITPKSAIARPTERGGMPRPPVKRKGGRGLKSGGSSEAEDEGSYTGVERKTNQRELNVPT